MLRVGEVVKRRVVCPAHLQGLVLRGIACRLMGCAQATVTGVTARESASLRPPTDPLNVQT